MPVSVLYVTGSLDLYFHFFHYFAYDIFLRLGIFRFGLASLCIARNIGTCAFKLEHYCLHAVADVRFCGSSFR